jgi:hypothetical protein
MSKITDNAQSKELEVISNIIDTNSTICERVLQDLNKGKNIAHRKGANGMSADQVLRSAIVKILFGFSYEQLAFHLVDSQSLSWFCRIGIADKGFKKSALNKNIKVIAKKRGLKETDMCRSQYVYRSLRRFRAGIESGISWLKRCLGLTRCTWKGWDSFKSYVWSSIVAANLLTIARAKP